MPLGSALKQGGKYFGFEDVGDSIEGIVVGADMRDWTDPSGEKGYWDNGDPKKQAVITIRTNLRDPEIPNDDGTRAVYVKWWGQPRTALQQAVRSSTGHLPEEQQDILAGGYYRQTRTEDLPATTKGLSPSHTYAFEYRPPASSLGKAIKTGGPVDAPVVQRQVPVTTNYTAPVTPAPAEQPPLWPPAQAEMHPGGVATPSQRSDAMMTAVSAAQPVTEQTANGAEDPMAVIRRIQAMHKDFGMTPAQIAGVVPQYSPEAIAAILVA